MVDQTARLMEDAANEVHQWRNLYFTRGGRTYWSWWIFDTEAECRNASRGWFREVAGYIARDLAYGEDFVDLWNSTDLVPFKDFRFAVPMPWDG
ncbi:hypothetical protein [Acidisoma cladoniae]|uniref:hypothetical protein n=1 Tax=Acidisoma cladoniae TaxID=3040935 RepID=UPI00254B88BB|nr:hypothetical protein [Acidisoma sp. PAMC 29798]